MRVLGLDTASGGCTACIAEDGIVLADATLRVDQGLAGLIPPLMADLVARAGLPGLISVVVGPGSFTGLRAGIAIAAGLGLAAGVEVVGVTAAEAWGRQTAEIGTRALWTAIAARPGRVFLDEGAGFSARTLDALPRPAGAVALAGSAANEVASHLAARGADVMLTAARTPLAADVAAAGLRRARGELPALAARPLYVDEPEARLPKGGLRPAPAATP